MTTLDPAIRQQIVVAAMTAAGAVGDDPTAWEARAVQQAARMTAILGNDRHPILRAIEQVVESKIFTGTVVKISKEQTSTRGLVTLNTGTQKSADGTELVRTERTDNPVGLAMARLVRELVGHRVVVWVEVEATKDGQTKVRVLRHIEDRGIDSDRKADDAA